MKALILAGGRGRRLDDLSMQQNKCMIKINNRPAVEYSLDCAVDAGVDDIVLVVGYRAEDIINRYGIGYRDHRIRYVIQWEQKGLVHAMECARPALESDDFLLLLGDEIMLHPRHRQMVALFRQGNVFALCGVLSVDNKELIHRTYMIMEDDQRNIHRLVEKPLHPLNNIMGTGDCVFKNDIFNYIEITPIHHERQEKELPDLIQCAVDDGKVVRAFSVCDCYTNINSKEDIVMAESFFA